MCHGMTVNDDTCGNKALEVYSTELTCTQYAGQCTHTYIHGHLMELFVCYKSNSVPFVRQHATHIV